MRGRPLTIAVMSVVLTSSAACQVTLAPPAAGVATIPVDVVAYRPDGSLVLFTAAGIHVFDGTLTNELSHIPLDAYPPSSPAKGAVQYSLSRDGTTAAVVLSYFQDTKPRSSSSLGFPTESC